MCVWVCWSVIFQFMKGFVEFEVWEVLSLKFGRFKVSEEGEEGRRGGESSEGLKLIKFEGFDLWCV